MDFSAGRGSWRGESRSRIAGRYRRSLPLSVTISKELKRRGFKFVGPVIVYAWMQAAGMVNDHSADCFRRKVCAKKSKK